MTTNTTYRREICPHETRHEQFACPICRGSGAYWPELRILTLWQPWASLVAWGSKKVETRTHRFPRYTGWVAIHAAVKKAHEPHEDSALALCLHAELNHQKTSLRKLPRGCILAVVWMGKGESAQAMEKRMRGSAEAAYGDYGPDRLALPLSYLQRLREPLDWKNGQGLRVASAELRERIAAQLR